jgi:predicted transcriptional regulator
MKKLGEVPRTVDTKKILDWMGERPNGVAELSYKANISASWVYKITKGSVPAIKIRKKVAATIGVTEEQLFPSVQ